MIYIIDHNDSFTYNVVHQFSLYDEVECDNYNEINERKLKKAFKKCRVPIQITGEEIISPEVIIPVTRVTSWIKSGYSNRRVNTGVTTTILFGPLGALGFLSKKHRYSFIVKGLTQMANKRQFRLIFLKSQT